MIVDQLKEKIPLLEENKNPTSFLRISMAGSCEREIDLQLIHGKKPVSFESYMRFQIGHMSEDIMIEILKKAFSDDIYDCQQPVYMTIDGENPIAGHCDFRIKSLKATGEIKSVSENTFKMIQNEGKPFDQHILQTNSYAKLLGDPYCIILYLNRNTGELLDFMFETDEIMFLGTKSKFSSALARKGIEVTPRPYNDATQSPCFYCNWKTECYINFKNEVLRSPKIEITSQEIVSHGTNAWSQRNLRLEAEKKETFHKDKLAQIIFGRLGASEAILKSDNGSLLCNLKVGKNNNMIVSLKELK